METTSNNSSAAQMTINTVHRIKNEVELSLEEAKSGKTTSWSSVDDYFKTMQQ